VSTMMAQRERRKLRRRRMFVDAKIGFASRFRLTCLVHNISDAGAKLVLRVDAEVPPEFLLRYHGKQVLARLRWRSGNVIGVEFASPPLSIVRPRHLSDAA
jgi:hypothetical protein